MDDMVSLLIFNNGEKKRCSLSLDNTWICSVWLWNSCLPDFRLLWTTEGGVFIYIRSSLEKYQIVIGTTPFSYTSNCMRAKKKNPWPAEERPWNGLGALAERDEAVLAERVEAPMGYPPEAPAHVSFLGAGPSPRCGGAGDCRAWEAEALTAGRTEAPTG
ncbi:hypothetical protein BRADI_3g46134v3 [Brachypodium distachyon]|uniref:Uncharacterized protein n=1 Tax=Brachypodium distachyon TaxID=15368 RepID=A0A0Q3M604_BRADI|nr:hypothetical protein BRADI_3g46134v3 [Brachypodium distachyon]